jgi:hypothetical protein
METKVRSQRVMAGEVIDFLDMGKVRAVCEKIWGKTND